MNGPFYYIIPSIGLVLFLASIVWVAIDLKKTKGMLRGAYAKKEELRSIIADAEMMLDELNGYSASLLKKIDQKNEEASRYVEWFEQNYSKIELLTEAESRDTGGYAGENADAGENAEIGVYAATDNGAGMGSWGRLYRSSGIKRYKAFMASSMGAGPQATAAKAGGAQGVAPEYALGNTPNIAQGSAPDYTPSIVQGRKYIDNLSLGKKYQEVMQRHGEGMEEADIAKELNIGRGEVELIMGLSR